MIIFGVNMCYVIASNRDWNRDMVNQLEKSTGHVFHYIEEKCDFTYDTLARINPKYVFLPHWSYIIPQKIYSNFECVIFHMTDVPFGRGGSPLQNLISRGIYETKISALRCEKDVDAGPVYLKRDLSLYGGAEEIYMRAGKIIQEMMREITLLQPVPVPQIGEVVAFQRRTPADGEISKLKNLDEVFDYIRMLDADGYPKAFLDVGNFRFEFERASMKNDNILADVRIKMRKEHE